MLSFLNNLILNTDSYKASHFLQYPDNTQRVSSYIESRGGLFDRVVFFGIQAFIKEYLLKPITQNDINKAAVIFKAHGVPFNQSGWQYILDKHNGYLPLEIQALPEGTVVPTRTALVQVVNTDPNVPWLTSYLETALLRAVWYPTTVATLSHMMKRKIYAALQESAMNPDAEIPFKLHDFGARGVSSLESAALGGMAHLVNFSGTDTLSGILAAMEYYNSGMVGFSIPAAEHSTITAWGREFEVDAYRNMVKQFLRPGTMAATVSDSYNIYKAVSDLWGKQLKAEVIASQGTMVIRPDSGEPEEIVPDVATRLYKAFGGEPNKKGYVVLNPAVRLIQGDAITYSSIDGILDSLLTAGFSAENTAFGMGGGLLQKVDRDTMKFAMKASAAEVNGQWRDVYKDPITDQGKQSKKGRLAVIRDGGVCKTVPEQSVTWETNLLRVIYRDGKLLVNDDFDVIRNRVKII